MKDDFDDYLPFICSNECNDDQEKKVHYLKDNDQFWFDSYGKVRPFRGQ